MNPVPSTLEAAVDAVNEAFFQGQGRAMPKPMREAAARTIAARQGLPGSYRGMFALDQPYRRAERPRLAVFTGEAISSWGGAAHIISEEAHHLGDGRWGKFRFHYTLSALVEMDLPAARQELRYASPICQRLVRRPAPAGPADRFASRRHALAERVLARC